MSEHARLTWTKSSLSQIEHCVEWAVTADKRNVYVRSSRNPSGPVVQFTRAEWEAFVLGVKRDEADINGPMNSSRLSL